MFTLIRPCPRCRETLNLSEIANVRRVSGAARWWQASHTRVRHYCPVCRAELRYEGLGSVALFAIPLFALWLMPTLWWKLDGVAELGFGLGLAIPVWLTWLVARRRLGLELRDHTQRFEPHFVVKRTPAPVPALAPAVEWLRVITPGLLPLYGSISRVLLWGVLLPGMLVMVVSISVLDLVDDEKIKGRIAVLVLAALLLGVAVTGAAMAAFGLAFVRDVLLGRSSGHVTLWWRVRSMLFVLVSLVPLPWAAVLAWYLVPWLSQLWSRVG